MTSIGFSVLGVGTGSFCLSGAYPEGSWQNLLIVSVTLISCLVFNAASKDFWKQLYVLFGLITGYIISISFGMVDFFEIGTTIGGNGYDITAAPVLLHAEVQSW